MAYRGPLQQDVCMREQAELRRLETGAPGSTELCIECDSVGVNVGIVGGSALPSESGGGAESLLLVQPDAVLANTSDTLVDGTALGPYVGGLEPVLGGGPMATGDDVIAAVRVAKKQKRKAMLLSKWYCLPVLQDLYRPRVDDLQQLEVRGANADGHCGGGGGAEAAGVALEAPEGQGA